VSSARFPVPDDYAGDPPPAEGLRQALALATDAELRLAMTMLVTGAKMAAGIERDAAVTEPLVGAAALFGWLSAVVLDETDRRLRLFEELSGDAAH
jgi:hypothetical protein